MTKKGLPNQFLEQALLYRGDECVLWPFGKQTNGYAVVWCNGKLHRTHRVVCERVHGPPPTPRHEAAHSCGNGHLGCINGGHLNWKTHTENQADKTKHGTSNRGAQHGMSKLSNRSVIQIRMLKGQLTQQQIADRFGVSQACVSFVINKKRWPSKNNKELEL